MTKGAMDRGTYVYVTVVSSQRSSHLLPVLGETLSNGAVIIHCCFTNA